MEGLFLPLLLLLVVAIPLVMGTRKQKRMAAEQQQLQNSLTVGDRVMTTSGLYATVADSSDESTIDLEIADGVITTWLRQGVRERIEPDADEDIEADDAETDETDEADEDDKDDKALSVERAEGDTPDTREAEVAPPLEHGKK